ncbi:MAG: hypothetical protein K1X72_11720 [Pyrinomonadaceae bacterium]|nr:hypothetical protein [Pyrinomonadaceae bacterium]
MKNVPVSRTETVAQAFDEGVLDYELKVNELLGLRPKKRFRVCLRCQKTMSNKNRCETCKVKFHDGLMMSWIKWFFGVSPK